MHFMHFPFYRPSADTSRAPDYRVHLPVARLFRRLASCALHRVFAGFESAGDYLDKSRFRRLAVLLHKHELAVWTAGEDGDIRPRR